MQLLAKVLSYFSYPRSDGSRVKRYVEPLSGVARHPLWLCLSDKSIDGQNTTYLLPENACTKDGNRAKGSLAAVPGTLWVLRNPNGSNAVAIAAYKSVPFIIAIGLFLSPKTCAKAHSLYFPYIQEHVLYIYSVCVCFPHPYCRCVL